MSLATQERMIDGMAFAVTQLPAMRSLRTLNRLGRAVGPALARAFATAPGGGRLTDADMSALGPAVEALFARLTDDELEGIVRDLLATATVNGTPLMPQFDLVMQGKVGTIFKLLAFAFEVNYGGFSDALRALGVAAQAASPSSMSITSSPSGPRGG